MMNIPPLEIERRTGIWDSFFPMEEGAYVKDYASDIVEKNATAAEKFMMPSSARGHLHNLNRLIEDYPKSRPGLNSWGELLEVTTKSLAKIDMSASVTFDYKESVIRARFHGHEDAMYNIAIDALAIANAKTEQYLKDNTEKDKCIDENWIKTFQSYKKEQEIELKVEEEKIFNDIRIILARDVEKSRKMAKDARVRFPSSDRIKKLFDILSPPRVTTDEASGSSDDKDFQWIKSNRWVYSGQWVALYEGTCIAAGKVYAEVRDKAKQHADLRKIIITYLPDSQASR